MPMHSGRRTLGQAVTAAVLDRIRNGELRPGDRLPTEKGLMEAYGVGRNAAREAVQALVAIGVVDVRPGRGATVIGVDADAALDGAVMSALLEDKSVDNLYEFRRLLEIEIARRAAERATEEDVEEIATCLAAFRIAARRGRPVSAVDDEFHAALARASHNEIFVTVLDAISGLVAHHRRQAERVPWAVERALAEHTELHEAVARHDVEAAAAVMAEHLEGAILAIREGGAARDETARPAVADAV
jgi:DNA-binding FadR family transcriptional regulator